jgi:type I restriction enzyme R subunit
MKTTADNIVKEFMDDETLKKIAQELTNAIKQNITIDWSVRKSAQAGMRRIIKRLLKKYDYPPKQAKTALEIVMKQAELMAGHTDPREIDSELGKVAETSPEYK